MTGQRQIQSLSTRTWDPRAEACDQEFQAVVQLHRESKATLGHLPYAAFEAARGKGQVILGLLDNKIAGYVLFSTPRQHMIKLVHVCVGATARRSGLARRMVEAAIAQNPSRTIITAHCRTDYGLDKFWSALDMVPAAQRPGRAVTGSVLTVWTRSIGQFDLFESAFYGSSKPKAVLDSNVVIDLFSSAAMNRPERLESLGLEADWLADDVEFTISPEVKLDVSKLQPECERDRVRESLVGLVTLRREEAMRETAAELLERMPNELTASDTSLSEDAKHLADAILAGADFFVTRDSNLLNATSAWIEGEFGIEVLRPVDLIQRLIPPAPPFRFRSEQLDSVGLRWQAMTDLPRRLEDAFLERSSNEKGAHFRKLLQAVLARPATTELRVLVDDRERFWALLATEVLDGVLNIPVLRVGSSSFGETIAFQLMRHLRVHALDEGCSRITVTDHAISPVLRAALTSDGFSGARPSVNLSRVIPPDVAARKLTATEVSVYERSNWPQVLLERNIPVKVVPIQPKYARELIGYNDTLMNTRARRALGLSRQVVYFSTPKGNWEVPSRVLWYVTKDPKASPDSAIRAVVAHSRVVEAAILSTEDAVEQYRAIGILRRSEIESYAKNGKVSVLRVEDTRLLESPVNRTAFDEILTRHGVTTSKVTTREAKPGVFDDVMRLQPEWSE